MNHPALFAAAWDSLPRRLASAGPWMRELAALSRARSAPVDQGRDWSPCHRAFWSLLDGDVAAAKSAFLLEWRDGYRLADPARGGNGAHYWNSQQFRMGDRWICAAMAAQLLILFDWLAVAGAFDDAEIDAIGTEAVDVLEAHIASHQKGRGHLPILHEPINQAAAMAAGQLVAGHLFGGKWRNWPRAQRLYASARQLVADNLGQHLPCGYDGDGFTYLRVILPPCHTLSIALLEDVEGGDWYHRSFAPNGISLASLNARLQGMVGWGGLSWPLGRYGYVRAWNGFTAAFASRRTGDPAYVQAARRDNDGHGWDTPWLGCELPLTLLWLPEGMDAAIAAPPAPTPRAECLSEAWWSGTVAADRVHVLASWLRGKAPQLSIEAHGVPLLLGGYETWPTSNAVQPEGFDWAFDGWSVPGGRLLAQSGLPRLDGAIVDTAGNYPASAAVALAQRTTLLIDRRLLLIHDRWQGAQAGRWQATVRSGAAISGVHAGVAAGDARLDLAADRPWQVQSEPESRRLGVGDERPQLARLVLAGSSDDAFAVVAAWNGPAPAPRRERADLLALDEARGTTWILLPGEGERRIGAWTTDATLAVLHADGALSLVGVRRLSGPDGTRLWCDAPVTVALDADGLAVHGLAYGGFACLSAPNRWLCLRRGNGLCVWARCRSPQRLAWDGDVGIGATLNGLDTSARDHLDLPAWSAPAEDLAATVQDGDLTARIAGLNRIRAAQDIRALPAILALLAWDSPELHHPSDPRLREATHLRAEAAATCAALGDRAAVPALIALLQYEAAADYAPREQPWARGFWGSTARVVALDALLLLEGREVLPLLPVLARAEVVPHAQEALERTGRLLATVH